MHSAARKLNRELTTIDEGTVVDVKDGVVTIRVGDFDCAARRAKSCLVAPAPGDAVLCSFGPGGRCFVLAVLEGAESEAKPKTLIEVEGDLDLVTGSGKLGLRAAKGVSVASGDEISLVGRALSVSALEGKLFVQKLAYLGDRLKAEIEAIKTVGTTRESIFERVSERVKRSFRTVEDIDQLKANKVDYAAETTLAMRAEHAVVHAEELIKVDGKQIQLG
ncbi:DUF3540 domain-containing protein [Polyangium sp. 15x6]|uniref:DUF3540 domain-containing protein n=1 Tax=Polyangium sp. 15x6 TaxID=3042687 RepID=UPI00249B1067|nr:DUF3540 domain-containing protein [Polyangium sp. 15x6]MDI3290148.1 DUF3540 domain-containing protein [Polyangium sp. 15x6]